MTDPDTEQQREDDRIAALLAGPRASLPEDVRAALVDADRQMRVILEMAAPWQQLRREMQALIDEEKRRRG